MVLDLEAEAGQSKSKSDSCGLGVGSGGGDGNSRVGIAAHSPPLEVEIWNFSSTSIVSMQQESANKASYRLGIKANVRWVL